MQDSPPERAEPAAATDTADAALIARVRRTVLHRIALASTQQHLTVRAGPDGWQALLDGVECKVLHEAGDVLSYLLRLAPGAVIPGHRHPIDEECIVLEGELRIGEQLVLHAGDYHVGRADVLHAPISTPTGALIFLRGAAPEPAQSL